MHRLHTLFAAGLLGSTSILAPTVQATPGSEFQSFLFNACSTASGDLLNRCVESNDGVQDGNVSGDSEDSLAPTQSLSNATNALAETRSRIKALSKRMADKRNEQNGSSSSGGGSSIKEVFRQNGFSVLVQTQYSIAERDATDLERGYETDSRSISGGVDYRIQDNWLVGGMIAIDRASTDFDADQAGNNFTPAQNEGSSDADSVSLNLFSTYQINENVYIEGLASWVRSDYEFNRNVIFQESSRTTPQTSVQTSADTDGDQFVVSLGAGYDKAFGATQVGIYGRLDYQNGSIDAYQETGGAGFAMSVDSQDTEEFSSTIGARISHVIPTESGVLVPQLSLELFNIHDQDTPITTSSFVLDSANNKLTYLGDSVDDSYLRFGIGLTKVIPNGIMAFVRYERDFERDNFDAHRIAAGIRVEL